MSKNRKFRGYAYFLRGSLLTGTMQPTKEEALRQFERYQPNETGELYRFETVFKKEEENPTL